MGLKKESWSCIISSSNASGSRSRLLFLGFLPGRPSSCFLGGTLRSRILRWLIQGNIHIFLRHLEVSCFLWRSQKRPPSSRRIIPPLNALHPVGFLKRDICLQCITEEGKAIFAPDKIMAERTFDEFERLGVRVGNERDGMAISSGTACKRTGRWFALWRRVEY